MTIDECKILIVEHICDKYESRWPDRVPKVFMYISLDFLAINGACPIDRELLIKSALSDLSSVMHFCLEEKGACLRIKFFINNENLEASYSYLDRRMPEERISELFEEIRKLDIKSPCLIDAMNDSTWLYTNLPMKDSVCTISLLKLLDFCLVNSFDVHYRKLSALILGDSKAYEKMHLAPKLARLLHLFSHLDCSDDEILRVYGICKTPEIFELTGSFEICRRDGSVYDFSFFKNAGLLSSNELDDISCFISHAHRVVFYENIASYYEALKHRKENEIIVFEAGFFGYGRKRLFSLLYESGNDMEFCHSGDIDAGGFDIFVQLKRIIPVLIPKDMDIATINANRDKAKMLTDSDRKRLDAQLEDSEYVYFHDVIEFMLEQNIKFEQENWT